MTTTLQMHSVEKIMKKTINFLIFVIMLLNAASLQAQNTPSQISDEQAHEIVLTGTPDDVKKLIQSGYDVNGVYLCNTLLNTAIKSMVKGPNAQFPNYAIEKVKILIEADADVNKVGCEQVLSPLEWAAILPLQFVEAEHDEIQALESLIKTGTDYCNLPNIIAKPCKDITPSELISIKKSIHKIYLEAKEKHNPLFLDMLKLLINNKANINQIDFAGQTVLHRAALTPKGETLELMKYLILKGADVNAKDSNGNTPLFIAYAVNNNDAVDLLIASGADVSIKNNFGVTYNQIVGTRKRDIYQGDGTFNTVNDNFN